MKLLAALSWVGLLALLPLPTDEAAAARELANAEELVRDGRHAKAIRVYEDLAEDYPNTGAGRIALERIQPSAYIGSAEVLRHAPTNRVEVVVLGDGFTLDHQTRFDELADDTPKVFERQRLLGEYLSYFNFTRANVVSAENGVDDHGRKYDTALGAHDSGTLQEHVAVEPELVQDVLTKVGVPNPTAIVWVQLGQLGSFSEGIATVAGRNTTRMLHEWGHAFAGLSDEDVLDTGPRGAVAVAANVAATDDPNEVPWKHFLEAKVPGIGIYKGADGRLEGAWKPVASTCAMNAEGEQYCPVCREAILLTIYSQVDPIDACTPEAHPREASDRALDVPERGDLEFTVQVLEPESHDLEVHWYVFPEAELPPAPTGGLPDVLDRRARGRLAPLERKPDETTRGRKGVHSFELDRRKLDPGLYRVVCRTRDDTELRSEKNPWVLSDPLGLTESERAWWVRVAE